MTLRGFRVSLGMFVSAVLLLVVGAGLLGARWWLRPISDAEQAVREEQLGRALERYAVAEKRFDLMPVSKRVLPDLYDRVITHQLSLMYSMQRYDEVIEKAGSSGSPGGRFWAGCALYAKAAREMKPDARLGWLSQSQEEFRRALEISPGDWDVKFNYELMGKLIGELRKQPKQEMMKLLKPPPKNLRERPKKVS